jgi:hypothetical protein
MKKCIPAILCGIFASAVIMPAAANDPKDEQAIIATLDAMAQGHTKKDAAILDKVYSPDLTYSHADANLWDKARTLKAVEGLGMLEFKFHDPNIRVYGNVALVRVDTELRNGRPEKPNDLHLNLLFALVRGPGPNGWQIVALQMTPRKMPAETK